MKPLKCGLHFTSTVGLCGQQTNHLQIAEREVEVCASVCVCVCVCVCMCVCVSVLSFTS